MRLRKGSYSFITVKVLLIKASVNKQVFGIPSFKNLLYVIGSNTVVFVT